MKALTALLTLLPALLHAAGISEPATTFYGKVLGTAGIQPYLITEGKLNWTIRRADGVDVTFHARLHPFGKGAYSYRLDIPHAALSLGLAADPSNVPLAMYEQTHRHLAVKLDNEPVALLGPAGEVFTSAQILRSATYRLDLGVNRAAPDTDGDGVPDWWCDQYGLDKQGNVGGTVLAGGLTIADCYALGLDPNADHTIPVLRTKEKVVYAGGCTALILDAFDLDTPLENLVYTVITLPFGNTALLAQDGSLTPLAIGGAFTQGDVLAGRLVYQHTEGVTDPGLLGLALSDGGHEPVDGTVRLLLYEPAINEISLRGDLYQFANAGYIVAEGASVNAIDAPVSYVFAGAEITGGATDDLFLQPDAAPCAWAGGAGADRFILSEFGATTVAVSDFSIADGDILDIMAFAPATGSLSDHVTVNGDTLLFSSGLSVTLDTLDGADLHTLVSCGALLTGLTLTPRVSVVATTPTALRNGPVPGVFTLTREGGATAALTVHFNITGSAVNGGDYQFIPAQAVIPAGAKSVEIVVTPYVAGGTLEVVAVLSIAANPAYILGAPNSAGVAIQPRLPEIAVEALINTATREGLEPGYFILWRDKAGASLAVQNTLGGDAVRSVDFQTYNFDNGQVLNPAMISFGANETEKLIEVAVLPGANFANGSKRVLLAPVPASRYAITPAFASAEITLIEGWETFNQWLNNNQSGGGFQPLGYHEPTDEKTLFKRYAYGDKYEGGDASGYPHPFVLSDGLTVRVRQPVGRWDVNYNVKGFTDLGDITRSNVGWTKVPPPPGQPDGPDWKYYRLNTKGDRGFISVEVK